MAYLSVRVPEEVRNRVKAIAAERGEKLQDLVGGLIERFLEEAERAARREIGDRDYRAAQLPRVRDHQSHRLKSMPIRRELPPLYPPNWPELSSQVRFERAGVVRAKCGGADG